MPKDVQSNACNACSRSKRKCGRQIPSCARCTNRGWSCAYPQPRGRASSSPRQYSSNDSELSVSASAGRIANELLLEPLESSSFDDANLALADDLMLDLTCPIMDTDLAASLSLFRAPSVPATKANWFCAPETWTIVHRVDDLSSAAVGTATMKNYITVLQSWLERWVSTGSNPFIHHCLYKETFPACVQVAYATMSSYMHRAPSNTDTILRIVEDRSNELLRENGAVPSRIDTDRWNDKEERDIDLFAQLARLHTLLVYQMIGLFDGDIRSRHVAEGHLEVQSSWATKLIRSATDTFSNPNSTVNGHLSDYLPISSTQAQQQWYLWILTESIRRTWLIAVSLPSIYTALQQRWSTCPGGIMYTNRNGLWNAASAVEWEKLCMEKNPAFLQRFDTSLLDGMGPGDIDDFGMAMIDMSVNQERLWRWRSRTDVQFVY